eukprot:scaffold1270_cov70-Skeletonema_dohrnii-CCMP3373.AAC.2
MSGTNSQQSSTYETSELLIYSSAASLCGLLVASTAALCARRAAASSSFPVHFLIRTLASYPSTLAYISSSSSSREVLRRRPKQGLSKGRLSGKGQE